MSLKRSSSTGAHIWTSGGSYNPWDVLRLDVSENTVPTDTSSSKTVGKGGLTLAQQKKIAKPHLQVWWTNGEGWSPFDTSDLEFKNCPIDSYRISASTEMKVRLKKSDQEKEAFIFYSIKNPRKGLVTINILGAITKKEIEENNNKLCIAKLHRSYELGAKEFRQKMDAVYANNDLSDRKIMELRNLKRYAFLFPLRRSLDICVERGGVTAKQLEHRMINFVVSVGWNKIADHNQIYSEWNPPRKPKWSTGDAPWSRDEFIPRHRDLQGMREHTDVTGYLLGGIAAATDPEYAELRNRAEKRRLNYFFSKWYNTEHSIRFLLEKNGMGDLLTKLVNDSVLGEYKKRNSVEQKPVVVLATMPGGMSRIIDTKTETSSSILQKLEAERKNTEEKNLTLVLPEYYGLVHFTECSPSLLERGASLVRGQVMVFFNEIEELILHWMELDQIVSNGKVRLNEQLYSSSPSFAFGKDALISAEDKQEIAKTKIGGNIFNVNLSSLANNSNKCGKLDIDVEDLLKISPLCITNMISVCQREKRSLKHNERISLTRYLAGMGIPIRVYESIAYPLFVEECKRTGERNTSEEAFKKRWNGKSMFSGKYSSLTCMSIKKAMDGAQSGNFCKCPFVDHAKMFNVNFTTLCRDLWKKENKDLENILKDLYFPSQHVYATLKARKWRKHIEIESGE